MKRIACFDVDGTLIWNDQPRPAVVELLKILQKLDYDIYVWSGGGMDYAKIWARRLGLEDVKFGRKGSFQPDIAVDDMADAKLGKNMIYVGPLPEET